MDTNLCEKVRNLRLSGLGYKTIAKQLSLGETKVKNFCRNINLSQEQLDNIRKTNLKYKYNTDFLEPPGEIAYYLLGAYLTDGCLAKNYKEITLSSKDEDWLQDISKIFVLGGKHLVKNNNCYRLTLNNNKIISWFIENNITPAKSLTLKVPEIPKEYIKDFLRGVIDGDGSILLRDKVNTSRKLFNISIVSASKNFIDGISSMLEMIGISNNIYEIDQSKQNHNIANRNIVSHSPIYRIVVKASDSVKLCETMYANCTICLKRKKSAYLKYLDAREEEKKDISKKFKMKYLSKEEMLYNVKNIGVAEYAKELKVTYKGLLKKLHKLGIYIKSL